MSQSIRHALLLGPVLLLVGCTSFSDFQALSPNERAFLVCERQATVRNNDADVRRYSRLITSARQAIAQGYRLEQQCEYREVPTGTKTVCESISTPQGERLVCEEKTQFSTKRDCRNIRIRVDAAMERSNIEIWTQALASAQARRDQIFQLCFQEVSAMSAADAYKRY